MISAYIYFFLLHTPAPLLVTVAAAVVCGTLGWRRTAAQARAAWDRAVVIAGSPGPDPYRAAPRETTVLRMPRLVPALGFISHALRAGHTGAAVVFAVAACGWRPNGMLAAAALYLATLGVVLSRSALALMTQSPEEARSVRRRARVCAALAIPTHGTIVLGIAALKLGWLEMLYCVVDYPSFKGEARWEGMTVRAFLDMESAPLFGPAVGGYSPYAWNMLGLAVLVYSCLSLIEAALALAVAHQIAQGLQKGRRHPGAHQPGSDVSPRAITAPVAAGEPPLPPPLPPPPAAAARTRSRP